MALIDIVNTGYVNTGYRWHRRTSGQRDRILDQITRPGPGGGALGRNWVVLGTTGEVASLDGAEVRRLGDIHALDVPEGWERARERTAGDSRQRRLLGRRSVVAASGELVERIDLEPPFCAVDRNRE